MRTVSVTKADCVASPVQGCGNGAPRIAQLQQSSAHLMKMWRRHLSLVQVQDDEE